MGAGGALDHEDRLDHALGLAYRHLNRRDRTVSEVRGYLDRHGVDADTAAAAIRALVEHGALDDERFAHLFAEDKRTLEEWGNERIKRALLARGIDPELVEATLGEEAATHAATEAALDAELGRALALLRRRFPVPPRERRERDRALGVLLRKGYAHEQALEALAAHARAEAHVD